MLKSNSKAFKARVKLYYDSIVTNAEEQEGLHTAFWTYYAGHKGRELNHVVSFENFVNSCSTSFDFETFRQRELLKSWFRQTDAQSERYSDDRVSETFCDVIYREFERISNAK